MCGGGGGGGGRRPLRRSHENAGPAILNIISSSISIGNKIKSIYYLGLLLSEHEYGPKSTHPIVIMRGSKFWLHPMSFPAYFGALEGEGGNVACRF